MKIKNKKKINEINKIKKKLKKMNKQRIKKKSTPQPLHYLD